MRFFALISAFMFATLVAASPMEETNHGLEQGQGFWDGIDLSGDDLVDVSNYIVFNPTFRMLG